MQNRWLPRVAACMVISAAGAGAQAPAGAPAGARGICRDGTYSTAAVKAGACRGHKGVQTWYAVPAPAMPPPVVETNAGPAMPAPTPAAAGPAIPAPQPARRLGPAQTAAARTAAPGGGPGFVWLNTANEVYHCTGDPYYGRTKAGAYMSEAEAKAKGGRAAGGRVCSGS